MVARLFVNHKIHYEDTYISNIYCSSILMAVFSSETKKPTVQRDFIDGFQWCDIKMGNKALNDLLKDTKILPFYYSFYQ